MCANDVSICIVTYNSEDTLLQCLEGIDKSYPLYVFDNNSSDASISIIKEHRPEAHVFQSSENIGFGCAHNKMLENIKTEFALLVNPDTILFKDTIELLLKSAAEYPNASIVSPLCVDGSGNEDANFKPYERGLTTPKCVDMVSGALMLLRVSTFEKAFFDERIFLYFEDDDLCFQVKQKKRDVLIEPRAKFLHASGHSTSRSLRGLWFRGYHLGWSDCYFQDKKTGFKKSAGKSFSKSLIFKKTRHFFIKILILKISNAAICCGMVCGAFVYCRGWKRKDAF